VFEHVQPVIIQVAFCSVEKSPTRTPASILHASRTVCLQDATDTERLDGANGLLLSPHMDHLFNEGYITFFSGQDSLLSRTSATALAFASVAPSQQRRSRPE